PYPGRFDDRVRRRLVLVPLCFDREVDHHDSVLLHYTHEQNQSDEPVHVERQVEDVQRQQRPEGGERQAGQNRERMDETLVQNSKHHVDHEDRQDEKCDETLLALLEGLGGTREAGRYAGRKRRRGGVLNRRRGLAQRGTRARVERDRNRRQLTRVVYGERTDSLGERRDAAQRNERMSRR